MSECRYISMVDAYHDGELNEQDRQAMSDHLPACPSCSAELTALADIRSVFVSQTGDRAVRLSQIELARLHQELSPVRANGSRSAEQTEIMRIAGLLSALAASVLIVSAAWLAENPTRHPTSISPVGVGLPASVASSPSTPAWERIAMTLQVDQRPTFVGDETGFARADLGSRFGTADGDMADLMLGLAERGNHANP